MSCDQLSSLEKNHPPKRPRFRLSQHAPDLSIFGARGTDEEFSLFAGTGTVNIDAPIKIYS